MKRLLYALIFGFISYSSLYGFTIKFAHDETIEIGDDIVQKLIERSQTIKEMVDQARDEGIDGIALLNISPDIFSFILSFIDQIPSNQPLFIKTSSPLFKALQKKSVQELEMLKDVAHYLDIESLMNAIDALKPTITLHNGEKIQISYEQFQQLAQQSETIKDLQENFEEQPIQNLSFPFAQEAFKFIVQVLNKIPHDVQENIPISLLLDLKGQSVENLVAIINASDFLSIQPLLRAASLVFANTIISVETLINNENYVAQISPNALKFIIQQSPLFKRVQQLLLQKYMKNVAVIVQQEKNNFEEYDRTWELLDIYKNGQVRVIDGGENNVFMKYGKLNALKPSVVVRHAEFGLFNDAILSPDGTRIALIDEHDESVMYYVIKIIKINAPAVFDLNNKSFVITPQLPKWSNYKVETARVDEFPAIINRVAWNPDSSLIAWTSLKYNRFGISGATALDTELKLNISLSELLAHIPEYTIDYEPADVTWSKEEITVTLNNGIKNMIIVLNKQGNLISSTLTEEVKYAKNEEIEDDIISKVSSSVAPLNAILSGSTLSVPGRDSAEGQVSITGLGDEVVLFSHAFNYPKAYRLSNIFWNKEGDTVGVGLSGALIVISFKNEQSSLPQFFNTFTALKDVEQLEVLAMMVIDGIAYDSLPEENQKIFQNFPSLLKDVLLNTFKKRKAKDETESFSAPKKQKMEEGSK